MAAVSYIGRFAPSPTGPLHFGSLLSAVGCYLQARAARGRWLLRIEDIDRTRVVPGADRLIVDALAAYGFEWDGPVAYQSRRLDHYDAALNRLRTAGRLFACTCSRAEIAAWHATHKSQANAPESDELRYPGTCRGNTSWDTNNPDVAIRFAVPANARVDFVDLLQGPQTDDVAESSGDFVVRRRDGFHAYHLAVVVDDGEQGVTEVVRGADLLSSTARHILLQQALGLPSPRYCHLPVALDARGQKLSKSGQSLAIDPADPLPVLCAALSSLQMPPPASLRRGPLPKLWDWAIEHWELSPLRGVLSCAAPAGLAISGG